MNQKLLFAIDRMLEIHFKKSAVVILDEYDVPIAKASSNGYYSQMLDVDAGYDEHHAQRQYFA